MRKVIKKVASLMLSLIVCFNVISVATAYNTAQTDQFQFVATCGYAIGAIDVNGALWTWGVNTGHLYRFSGILGNGSNWYRGSSESPAVNEPVRILDNVRTVSFGDHHAAAIKVDGSLWMWGKTTVGEEPGNIVWVETSNWTNESFTLSTQNKPKKVMDDVEFVSCSDSSYTAAIKTDGSLLMWGSNYSGQLGIGSDKDNYTPTKVMDDVVYASCGNDHTAAIKSDGSLWMWGDNSHGQLGIETVGNDEALVPVKVLDDVATVFCGTDMTAVIKTDGTLWMWGLLPGPYWKTTSEPSGPLMTDVAQVGLGYESVVILKNDGTLWGWGNNECGTLGNGTKQPVESPTKIMEDVLNISTGDGTVAALKTDGSIWVWGTGADRVDCLPDDVEHLSPFNINTNLEFPVLIECVYGNELGSEKVFARPNATFEPEVPTREGYEFDGWYTDETFTTLLVSIHATPGLVIYAKWKEKTPSSENKEDSTSTVVNGHTGEQGNTQLPVNTDTIDQTSNKSNTAWIFILLSGFIIAGIALVFLKRKSGSSMSCSKVASIVRCSCGAENAVDARFCQKCGKPVVVRGRCSCGHQNNPDANFCAVCGKDLSE